MSAAALTVVPVADLRTLLTVAMIQVDAVDEDEAEAYGLTLPECERLHGVAATLLATMEDDA